MRKLIKHFCDFIFGKHRNNTLPRYWILAVDTAIVIIAYVIAILVMYFNDIAKLSLSIDWTRIWIFPLFYLVTFLITRTYDGMLRYSGFNDIRKIFTSCSITFAVIMISKMFFLKYNRPIAVNYYPPFTIIVYHYLITMVLICDFARFGSSSTKAFMMNLELGS